jgi:aromatic ring-cleaving dioxygenase
MPTALRDASLIRNWHAHVYFDAQSRQEAQQLRQAIETQLADQVEVGRFHEKAVGPHPKWSYQLGIGTADFARVLGWLALNHGTLDVFVHPNTGDPLRDHRDAALWIGSSHRLVLSVFDGDGS